MNHSPNPLLLENTRQGGKYPNFITFNLPFTPDTLHVQGTTGPGPPAWTKSVTVFATEELRNIAGGTIYKSGELSPPMTSQTPAVSK